jgi:hypothetical protein
MVHEAYNVKRFPLRLQEAARTQHACQEQERRMRLDEEERVSKTSCETAKLPNCDTPDIQRTGMVRETYNVKRFLL